MLTQVRLMELLTYNSDTGVFIWTKRSSKHSEIEVGSIAGYLNQSGYRCIRIDGELYKAHRLVWLYTTGSFPSGEQNFIDHIDGDKSNNCLRNLRPCSQSENRRNTGKSCNNTSGFKGVSYHKISGKYQATIANPETRKREHIGLCTTPEEAAIMYQIKAQEYYKEFYKDTTKTDMGIIQRTES